MQTLLLCKRHTFRQWISLEEIREDAQKAAENGADDFPDLVYSYLSAALNIPTGTFDGWSWVEVLYAYTMVAVDQLPDTKLPMLNPTGKPGEIPTWNYKGRTWNYYSHMLAKEYGWSLEYIADLDRNTALALIQEILTDEQLRKEFEYGMSEIAYPYNKSTKKSEFKPLERPYWMLPKIEQPKKIKIRRDFLPIGNVVSKERHEEKQAPPTKS